LAHLTSRLAAEEQIHVEHVDGWVKRLGRGGDEARGRVQAALNALSPLAGRLFEPTAGLELLEAAGIYPKTETDSFDQWSSELQTVAEGAGLQLQLERPNANLSGGRRGEHSDIFGSLLDELTEVYRLEPEAAW
jgi:ring-1,2-phenylacetyl-CoA epoxidase subunit PaaC